MSNVLSIATSSLLANQAAIQTVGNNIANVNTDGFSRQRVEMGALPSVVHGGMYFGTGTQVTGLSRMADQYAINQLRDSISRLGEQDTLHTNASQLESYLMQAGLSVDKGLQNFFSSLQEANNNPDYTATRATLFYQAEGLVGRFHSLDRQFDNLQESVNNQLTAASAQINAYTREIAQLNDLIGTRTQNEPSELLDKRDKAINNLAQLINVNLTPQEDGSVTVSIGSGQILVHSNLYHEMSASRSLTDPSHYALNLVEGQYSVNVTDRITGGLVGGLLQFQNTVLTPAQQQLGVLSLSMSDTMNAQHQLGINARGELGGNLFNDINSPQLMSSRALINQNNSGDLSMQVHIDSPNALSLSDYKLVMTGASSYTVLRLSDDTARTFSGFPMVFDGVTVSAFSGSSHLGDTFILSPTRKAATSMDLAINNGSDIALGSPILTRTAKSNTGSGAISAGMVTNIGTSAFAVPKQLSPPVRVEFLSGTTYQLVNDNDDSVIEGPLPFTPEQSNALFPTAGGYDSGYRLSISGSPSAGDRFNIDYNHSGDGDNRNGALLMGLQDKKVALGSNNTFFEVYSNLVGSVGVQTNRASLARDANELLVEQAQSQVNSISGVNLDEEAADLLKYQQAYQASTKLIQISVSIMDTLLRSLG